MKTQTIKVNKDNLIGQLMRISSAVTAAVSNGKDFKQERKKRSLDANAYYWKLLNEIGNVLKKSKDELHIEMLQSYGQHEPVSVRSDIDVMGYFKYYKVNGISHVNGKEFTHYLVYKPSSEMDSKEMSILIEGVVQEAQQLGIETLPPHKLAGMIKEWGKAA